ncbi:response regulator [Alkalimarinus alittae]|uniref:Response regulator n=1 Tax=Alkalimarinus alittae TaxID=2961619 RepID=A0ABY6N446_9ALTE|nr:response regulator [Alkalimarinus alittae]UZE96891.1 response regulator [Alkalimarinus alittae]
MDGKMILLVEDNPDDELLTIEAMNANAIGSEIIVVRDGEEALEYLLGTGRYSGKESSLLPSLVLLDLNLPKINGLEVLRRLRAHERTKLMPVVILTSSIEDEDRLKGYSFGANSYVRKPVDFEEFVNTAGQLGSYWLGLNEAPPAR